MNIARDGSADYLQALEVQLRLREVPGDRIGQILAEVNTHAIDTGEDPVETFGSPAAYADAYVSESTQGRSTVWRGPWWAARFVSFVVGAWLLRTYLLDAEAWQLWTTLPFGYIGYLVILGLLGALISRWLLRPWAERQAEHSPSMSVAIPPRALVLGGLGTIALGPMAIPARGGLLGSGMFLAPSGPAWLFALVGALLVAAAVWAELRTARVLMPSQGSLSKGLVKDLPGRRQSVD
jgi:hypothetical protein